MYLVSLLLFFLGMTCSAAALASCATNDIVACIMPILGYVRGPQGQQMNEIQGLEYTEEQLTAFCRAGRLTAECYFDTFERCIPFAPDFRDLFGGMAAVMKGCDRSGFYSKAHRLLQCTATLTKTGGKTNACYNAAVRMLKKEMPLYTPTPSPWTGEIDLSDLLRRFGSGKVPDAMCCNTKYYKTCSGAEVADKCGTDAQQVFDDFNMAVLNGFNCSQERLTRCPPQAEPLPEDYLLRRTSIWEYQLDFAVMIQDSISALSLG